MATVHNTNWYITSTQDPSTRRSGSLGATQVPFVKTKDVVIVLVLYHAKIVTIFIKIRYNFESYFTNYKTNTRHVCTYLNAFFMAISNIVMKFDSF